MSKNNNLQDAKNLKNDEFYTQLSDIEKELVHYNQHFKDKVVFCNCDDPEWSNFWKYFVEHFQELGLKRLLSTHYEQSNQASYMLEYCGKEDDNKSPIFGRLKLKENGDFRSKECLNLLDESDIVVSNPPFSLFREYINILIEHKKQYLILGNMNAITYKEVFPHIQEGNLRLGVNSGSMTFRVPNDFEKNNVYEKDGVKYAKFGNICWYTNLEHYKMHEFIDLQKTYKENESQYPQYDNYAAIEVGKLANIPKDYAGAMGVPITFLQHYNPEQFDILGNLGSYAPDGYSLSGAVYVNGKKIFKRILIRRHQDTSGGINYVQSVKI